MSFAPSDRFRFCRIDVAVHRAFQRNAHARSWVGNAAHAAVPGRFHHVPPILHVGHERRVESARVDDDSCQLQVPAACQRHGELAVPVVARTVVGHDDWIALVDGEAAMRMIGTRVESHPAAARKKEEEGRGSRHGLACNALFIRESSTLFGKCFER